MVPLVEFSDMFCYEQLSPNESKQICNLKPCLEVRLYLGATGLIVTNPVGCVRSVSQGPASSVCEDGYPRASEAPDCAATGKRLGSPGKNTEPTPLSPISGQEQGMFGRGRGSLFPVSGLLHHDVGWERNQRALSA